MKCIYVFPGFEPVVMEVENELSELQKMVGGYIEVICNDEIAIILDEEGKLKNKPVNKYLVVDGVIKDFLVGPIILCGCNDDGEFTDIPEDLIQKYFSMASDEYIEI